MGRFCGPGPEVVRHFHQPPDPAGEGVGCHLAKPLRGKADTSVDSRRLFFNFLVTTTQKRGLCP